MYCGDSGTEGKQRGMGVGLSGRGAVGDRDMVDEGVLVEAAGNHCRVCRRADNLRALYRVGEYGGIQQAPTVLVPMTFPHTGGTGGR